MRLTFLCAAATASSRIGGFPTADEPLDEGGRRKAAGLRLRAPSASPILTSPSRSARETVEARGLAARIEPRLADQDFGGWAGRSLADVQRDAPDQLAAWIADPTAAPPAGETMAALVDRVGSWLAEQAADGPATLVVSHASVMRAALVHTLAIPAASALRIDIAPLATLTLSYRSVWRLQELRGPR